MTIQEKLDLLEVISRIEVQAHSVSHHLAMLHQAWTNLLELPHNDQVDVELCEKYPFHKGLASVSYDTIIFSHETEVILERLKERLAKED